ncbi:MAG: hypothetical protein KDD53_08925, partial [Bdellovibrionales bacterium]|nr:hypothetical protein [Bdellovibrionales bacterium]
MIVVSPRKIIATSFCLTLSFCFTMALSREALAGTDSIEFQVRTVSATHLLTSPKTGRSAKVSYAIDRRLSDLKNKLKGLHYSNYDLVESHRSEIPFKTVKVIDLGSGQQLTVKPLYRKDDRVCLWVKWNDDKGLEVLDTRMHVNIGESTIAG